MWTAIHHQPIIHSNKYCKTINLFFVDHNQPSTNWVMNKYKITTFVKRFLFLIIFIFPSLRCQLKSFMIWLKYTVIITWKTKRYALEICSFASIWMHGMEKKYFNLNKTAKSKYLKEDIINMSFRWWLHTPDILINY